MLTPKKVPKSKQNTIEEDNQIFDLKYITKPTEKIR